MTSPLKFNGKIYSANATKRWNIIASPTYIILCLRAANIYNGEIHFLVFK